jgi:phage major head subunit gpT-like protein
MPEGTPVQYRTSSQLFQPRFIYKAYGVGYAITKILVEDGEAINLGKRYSEEMARACIETRETLAANILNRGFTSTFTMPGGDGKQLFASDHPTMVGTFSNVLSTAANLSQTSLEQMLIQIRRDGVDYNGKKINLEPKKLVVAPDNELQAQVLLRSALRTGGANNDINPIVGRLNPDPVVVTRLTNSKAWYIMNQNVSRGLLVLTRRKMERGMEGDFETDSMRYKATFREAWGWVDPRAMFGTPGV